MRRRLPLSRPLKLGQVTISKHASTAPSPRDGEVRHTALPDTFDGIRFEIRRMIQYVQDAAHDPVVRENAEQICEEYAENMGIGRDSAGMDDRRTCIEAIEAWCRAHYVYLNDPPNIEFIQTPRRMVKQTRVPPDVIRFAIEPLFDAMKSAANPGDVDAYQPPGMTWGDCDEGSCFVLSHAGAKGMKPLKFDFGGHDGTLHHVWGKVHLDENDEKGIATDLTEPDYKLGDYSRFEHYESVEIPL